MTTTTTAKKATWTDELKEEVVQMYLQRIDEIEEEKRPAMSAEIVTEIAGEMGKTTNSVRAILQRAKREDSTDVYVKKAQAPKAKAAASGGKKMSKADAQAELLSALQDLGAEVTEDLTAVIEKMTGKAAQTVAGAIRGAGEKDGE